MKHGLVTDMVLDLDISSLGSSPVLSHGDIQIIIRAVTSQSLPISPNPAKTSIGRSLREFVVEKVPAPEKEKFQVPDYYDH